MNIPPNATIPNYMIDERKGTKYEILDESTELQRVAEESTLEVFSPHPTPIWVAVHTHLASLTRLLSFEESKPDSAKLLSYIQNQRLRKQLRDASRAQGSKSKLPDMSETRQDASLHQPVRPK